MSEEKKYLGFFKVDERKTLIWKNKKQIENYISELPTGKYMIQISEYTESRSINQNKYYWKLVEIIASNIGYEVDEMHDVFKYKFLKKTFQDSNGNLVNGVGSTRKLNSKEFTNYIDKIKKYVLTELEIILPESFE